MKIAICFFGITRSLPYTVSSIEKNIISPSKSIATTKIFGHFFDLKEISNPRSGESVTVNSNHYDLIKFDNLQTEKPDLFLPDTSFERVKSYGDIWNDDFMSLKNLYHQLHSLKNVFAASRSFGADITLLLRPDLLYIDNFAPLLKEVTSQNKSDFAYVPSWQPFGGMNDRLAIVKGSNAGEAIANRLNITESFCQQLNEPLHAEKLLKFSLNKAGVDARHFNQRAIRVRANGRRAKEFFGDSLFSHIMGNINFRINLLKDTMEMGLPQVTSKK
ncbi:hypothetical protein [Pseudophaeobacter arcticus]